VRPLKLFHATISFTSICCGARDVDFGGWPGDIGTPVMSVDRILLIDIQLEELIVGVAFEVLVSMAYHQLVKFVE
jgi:hypothetical protein